MLRESRVVLVGSDDVGAMTDAARRARAAGVRTVGDLERIHEGTQALVRELDVIVMAASFPKALTGHTNLGKALKEIADFTAAAIVCVTLGEEGCLALVGGDEIQMPAFAIDAVDTTGAGDSFAPGSSPAGSWSRNGPVVSEICFATPMRWPHSTAWPSARGPAAPRRSDVEAC